jgi:hypothetical protein
MLPDDLALAARGLQDRQMVEALLWLALSAVEEASP